MLWTANLPAFEAAVTAPTRSVRSRVEAVAPSGASLGDVPCDACSVSFEGGTAEQWAASFRFTDPSMIPTSPRSVLDGRSGTRLRVWWVVDTPVGALEVPCGTYIVEDPELVDNGLVEVAVSGLDPLAVARRGRYGGAVLTVGGMTVSNALKLLFATLVPSYPVRIAESSVTLPAQYQLWDRDPAEDWEELAGMAGMIVRTDRWGVITVDKPPAPPTPVADWQEGPGCPVEEMKSSLKTSTIPRRVIVVSTSPDVSPVIVGKWDNPDVDSWDIVTEQRIESTTTATQEAANNLARASGERWRRPQQSVSVTVPARPDLGYHDLVNLSRLSSGVSGSYAVSGWSLEMPVTGEVPALMSVQMETRQ